MSDRFANLRRASARIEAGSIPHPQEPTAEVGSDAARATTEAAPTSPTGGLRERLQQGGQRGAATIRMSLDLAPAMHAQIGELSHRSGLPRAEVVRMILAEALPELLG